MRNRLELSLGGCRDGRARGHHADQTYDALLGIKGGVKRVLPRDPACSPLMVRLESPDPNFVMPRGDRLSEPALCVFVQWIKQGAQKN